MALPAPNRFALMLGEPAWQRAAFDAHTALVDGVVQLAWEAQGEGGLPLPVLADSAGLAFDAACRLYQSLPGEQRVQRWLWAELDPARPQRDPPPDNVLVNGLDTPQVWGGLPVPCGGFVPLAEPPTPAFTPRALACDDAGHLYVLDSATAQVWIVDLAQRSVLRAEAVPADAVDIAWQGAWLWVLCASGALRQLAAAGALRPAPVSAPAGASRLAFAADGRLYVLLRAHAADAEVVLLGRPGHWLAAPQTLVYPGDPPFACAAGLAVTGCDGHQHLVVARRREELFSRVDLGAEAAHALAEPLAARRYDGLGIAATPDGRVVYMTPRGPRHATAARLHYHGAGRVVGFRLDAGEAQARWGRVFIDACLPPDTALRVQGLVSDDDLDGPRLARTPPANQALAAIARPEATPLPLQALLPAADEPGPPVFQRSDGSEQPWLVETERFDTFEALAPTTPGRYLWLVFDLQGHSRATPKLRSVRAETPAHDWLSRLPQLYARHAGMRDFLQRFLAPLAGLDDDLAAQSDQRHALLKPCSTPAAALPWLARWVGLTLDERWSEAARRSFVKEAAWLFRLRGTVWSLKRMVEIVTGAPVLIVEQFRLRGLGRLGPDPLGEGWDEPAVLGMGLRVGGPLGNAEVQGGSLGEGGDIADSFALNAHRFSVLVQAPLDADTEAAVRHLLDVHRPAHTLVTLCSLEQGARLGRSLQIGLSTVVGPDAGFTPLQLGGGTLGRAQVLGRPAVGAGLRLA
jgi:phage tail-like protein